MGKRKCGADEDQPDWEKRRCDLRYESAAIATITSSRGTPHSPVAYAIPGRNWIFTCDTKNFGRFRNITIRIRSLTLNIILLASQSGVRPDSRRLRALTSLCP